ncbi:Arginine methyltransferase 10 isoform 1 [Theobroma cacao]|uniref:Protein arginine N-methyltransferase PRMT10 n=1 Tax=Theobroma cacao TaxID=3641 RepID=A0A061GM50_THECC|nr:Arginine methyltransferase 10 isoform 1 [Theobroma cacao]
MGSRANGVVGGSSGNGAVDKGVDFANYFCTYAFLYHQKEMLCDRVRMDAYYNAIFQNKHHFQGKAVLDVGTGSGILAIWSAQAGARKVYAVEATKMSEHARTLVKANNLQDIVEVIEGSMEEVVLPEKVDVIISEWMGYFLLRESMFDSVIFARDHWLKSTGVMYPSHARMWVAPIRSGLVDQKKNDYEGAMDDWFGFIEDTKNYYGVEMSVLTKPFSEEQEKYYLQTSLWSNLHPHQVIGTAAVIKEIDCLTATVNDILQVRSTFSSAISMEHTRFCGFGGWFDVHFRGRREDPAQQEIELTTAPSTNNGTHWGQQVFLLHPPTHVDEGSNFNVSFSMNRSKENHRLMEAMDFLFCRFQCFFKCLHVRAWHWIPKEYILVAASLGHSVFSFSGWFEVQNRA